MSILDKTKLTLLCPEYKSVRLLSLSINKINKIDDNLFAGLSNIHELYLGGNEIVTLNKNTFSGLTKLKKLYIESNNIKYIEENAFDNVLELDELNLSNNYIKYLHPNIFSKLHKLKTVHLDCNYLINIDDLFTNNNLKKIYIQNNCLLKNYYFNNNIISDVDYIMNNYDYLNDINYELNKYVTFSSLYELIGDFDKLKILYNKLNGDKLISKFKNHQIIQTKKIAKKFQYLINFTILNYNIKNLWKQNNKKIKKLFLLIRSYNLLIKTNKIPYDVLYRISYYLY